MNNTKFWKNEWGKNCKKEKGKEQKEQKRKEKKGSMEKSKWKGDKKEKSGKKLKGEWICQESGDLTERIWGVYQDSILPYTKIISFQ